MDWNFLMPFSKYRSLKGTVLIVTYGRSGSTLLQSILNTIPEAHIRGENYNALEGVFRATQRLGKTRRKWGEKGHPRDHPWFGANTVKPRIFEQQMGQVFTDTVLNPPSDARWIGFKEIRHQNLADDFSGYLNFCTRVFPNVHFVFNSRRCEDVAKSRWWKKQDAQNVHATVRQMDERFAEYCAQNPQNCFHAQHDLTTSDPTHLEPLFQMLGEKFKPEQIATVLKRQLAH
jgi:hypothetical protein